MPRPAHFVIEDDEDDSGLKSPQTGRYSEDSIDESGLNRDFFEKDERFRDEGKMEQGDRDREEIEAEDDGFLYGKVPVRLNARQVR